MINVLKKSNVVIYRFVSYLFLTYGFIYSAYNSWVPEIYGGNDFYQYYLMYLNPFENDAISPFAYRIIGSIVTNLIFEIGIDYNTVIAIADSSIQNQVFFAAIMSNYIGLLLTAVIVSLVTDEINKGKSSLVSFLSGASVFFLFATMPYNLSGIQESWSMFFYALIYLCYLKKSRFIFLLLFLSIFQREIIPIVFFVFVLLDSIHHKSFDSSKVHVLVVSIFSFLWKFL